MKTFGAPTTYTTPDGSITIQLAQAIFDERYESTELVDFLPQSTTRPVLDVRLADLVDSNGNLVKPVEDGIVVASERTWEVRHVEPGAQNTSAKLFLLLRAEP